MKVVIVLLKFVYASVQFWDKMVWMNDTKATKPITRN
jgi:hypothetical protein